MKFLAALAIVPLLSLTPAHAQAVDFRNLSCQQLSGMPPQTVDLVAVWLEGYSSDEEDPESMQVDFSDTIADDLRAHCAQNPSKTVVQAADDLGE